MRTFLLTTLLAGILAATVASGQEETSQQPQEQENNPMIAIQTNHGLIKVELFADKAPISVENFLHYVRAGFYENTLFHRVISDFMVQGGGFSVDMSAKPTGAEIQNEADNGLSNTRGTLAMARKPHPHSATAQFFINVQDNMFLDHKNKSTPQAWGYTVFGRVTEGMEVVDDIRFVATANHGMHQNVPVEPVIIEKIEELAADAQ